MKKILQSYLRRLTNLSAANRSLLLLRLYPRNFLDIHKLDYAEGRPSFEVIRALVERTQDIRIGPRIDPRDEASNKLSEQIRRLQRRDQYIYEERGSRDLYIGWPFVRGKLSGGISMRCPLLFFPVGIEAGRKHWSLTMRESAPSLNKSFLLAYSYFNQIALDESILEKDFDEAARDITKFRTDLYHFLSESPVEINFNQDLFIDRLQAFEEFSRSDFESHNRSGTLKLFPEAALGIFPQAGSYLVPDYVQLLEENQYHDIEEFFRDRARQEDQPEEGHSRDYMYFLNQVKEEQTFTAFKLDAYQESALKAVKRGNSLVVQGPPGTGKSQLICNLISDFIARGQRVLLVCQKRAALDVVYERLRTVGLHDFTALVHDYNADRKAVYEQIFNQTEKLHEYKQRNNGLDSVQLERSFLQACRKIDQITEELELFRESLFDESEAGISVKELYLTCSRYEPSVNLTQEYRNLPLDRLDGFIEKLSLYCEYNLQLNKPESLWSTRRSFAGYGVSDLKQMQVYLEEIPQVQLEFSEKTKDLLGVALPVSEGLRICEGRDDLNEMINCLDSQEVYRYFRHMISSRDVLSDSFPDTLWLSTVENTLKSCFDDPGPELSLFSEELGHFMRVLKRRTDAQTNFVRFIRWRFSSSDMPWLKKVLQANELLYVRGKYDVLEKKIDFRLNLEHNITKLRNTKWLIDLPEGYDLREYRVWFEHQLVAVRAYLIFDKFRNFKQYFSDSAISLEDFRFKIAALIEYTLELPGKVAAWQKYFYESRIDLLQSQPEFGERMREELFHNFDALCDFDQLHENLENWEQRLIQRLIDFHEHSGEHSVVELFQNSLRLAWIDHIEMKYPVLRSVNTMRFDHMLKDLQESVKQKLKISADIALMKAREGTYRQMQFNRLNNRVTYRDLIHQVTKKRQVWPMRKLIGYHAHEIFQLLPCWMGSPDVVSAIFPMEQIFDLVVFDEASQCFSEQGIPAMYRGKQVVVAGDDKQLSPFDLYTVRWEEEPEEQEPALEVDSLLELAKRYLMSLDLRGHYRSQSLDLIEFSNREFYGGRLRMLPHFDQANSDEASIRYIRVDGVWENNSNETEARYIAGLVEELVKEDPGKSIGIVTFNAPQQELISDYIEAHFAGRNFAIPADLIVKNIENIQGDEKDIVIFSVGYAPGKNGVLVHKFGSLNTMRGENRLNVAVTRARERIYVVSSILPHQLVVEYTLNEGPKLLKRYLQYAMDISEGRRRSDMEYGGRRSESWYLKQKIVQQCKSLHPTLQFTSGMPFADLAITSEGKYVGLVLTDDELYYQSVSAKEAHAYRPFLLSGKGWKFKGVFSREFWHDPKVVVDRIGRLIGH